MPVYTVFTENYLTPIQKKRISKKITDLHSTVTNVPSELITVLFRSGFHLEKDYELIISGILRTGGNRTDSMFKTLGIALVNELSQVIAIDQNKIHWDFLEVKAKWVFGRGAVLPSPGEEAQCCK
ncbi:conserved hypothetical protein [Tenacibaculum litopenaei]|uniref:tautomerase family protein n=1 Tax=Tenacibaculum litopenaei TaxID=396016 RepID=UPI0038937AB9